MKCTATGEKMKKINPEDGITNPRKKLTLLKSNFIVLLRISCHMKELPTTGNELVSHKEII